MNLNQVTFPDGTTGLRKSKNNAYTHAVITFDSVAAKWDIFSMHHTLSAATKNLREGWGRWTQLQAVEVKQVEKATKKVAETGDVSGCPECGCRFAAETGLRVRCDRCLCWVTGVSYPKKTGCLICALACTDSVWCPAHAPARAYAPAVTYGVVKPAAPIAKPAVETSASKKMAPITIAELHAIPVGGELLKHGWCFYEVGEPGCRVYACRNQDRTGVLLARGFASSVSYKMNQGLV